MTPAPRAQLKKEAYVVGGCGGWRTPDESWLDMESAKDEETFFMNMVVGEEDKGKHEEDILKPQEEYEDLRARKEGARRARGQTQCISDEIEARATG